ncbi:MAG: OmpA family protein [Flavobacteriales bacterium]|nr:OmpA family protein [Flavobacteriales bacterium]
MKRFLLFLAALVLAFVLQAQLAETRTTLHFAVDDHRLDERALAEIDRFLATTDIREEHEFTLLGHTDADGHLGYNEVLARARARSVRERLISLGVDPARISTRAFGERDPIATNTTDEDKQLNRRVELVFSHQLLGGLDDLNARIASPRVSTHRIDPTKENWLRGQQGVVVRLAANSLVDAAGKSVGSKATVTLTEAVALNDMIAEGLSTRSDGKILETGGMLRVDAVDASGSTLALSTGSTMLVSLPAAMRQTGMTLFTSSDGGDWDNTGTEPLDLRNRDLPKRPQCVWPEYLIAVYKADLSGKPALPSEPARPREPAPPRRESYTSNVAWYQALSKNKIAADDEQRYQAAMTVYADRVVKYEQKMEQYQADCKTWPERYAKYKRDHMEWVNDTLCAREDFYKKARPEAEERYQQRLASFKAECERREAEWRPLYEARMAEIGRELDSLGLSGARDLGTYVFAASQLGWINCDRFYEVPASQKYDLIVHDADTTQKNVYLVYTGINSMMRLQKRSDGSYAQDGVPRNQPATVVAYKVENGKAYLCKQAVDPRKRMDLNFKPASVAEIRDAIQGLRKS